MSNLPVMAIIGMAILVSATVGFGATLTTTPEFNLIGASNDNLVGTARGNITALVWTEEVGLNGQIETDQIIFTVGNEDISAAHDFEVCAVIQFDNASGTFYSPTAGSSPACTTTGALAASAEITSQAIDFLLPVNVTEMYDISFAIEELS